MGDARDQNPGMGEQIGEGIGGIGGTLGGAAIGAAAGPLGAILGGIAGALGGWWAGEKVGRAAEDAKQHDTYYSKHYSENPLEGYEYDKVRTAYTVGHVAGSNPEYSKKSWAEVDGDLQRSWGDNTFSYTLARPYVHEGFRHRRSLDNN